MSLLQAARHRVAEKQNPGALTDNTYTPPKKCQ